MRKTAVRAEASRPGKPEEIGRALPWLVDEALVGEDIVYDGPLERIRGREEYLLAMRGWQEDVPGRLEGFSISDLEVRCLQPGEVTSRWSCTFVAPLPPTARLRGLPQGMVVLPEEKVQVETRLRAVLTLDRDGRVARHKEEIVAGFGVPDAIARYELLTARRRNVDPVSWYWRVLRETTIEELAFYSGGRAEQEELEWRFNEMILRNLAYGIVIGTLIWAGLKALLH